MEKFYELVIRHRKIIFAVFIGIAVICAMAQKFVSVNYDMNSYLPEALSYKDSGVKRWFSILGLSNCTKPNLFCSVVRK